MLMLQAPLLPRPPHRGLSPERLVATDNAAEIAALRVIACTQGPAARLCHAAGLRPELEKPGRYPVEVFTPFYRPAYDPNDPRSGWTRRGCRP